jgi:hypothetical protein
MLSFSNAWFECYGTNRRTDRIPEFNTYLKSRDKNASIYFRKREHEDLIKIFKTFHNTNKMEKRTKIIRRSFD